MIRKLAPYTKGYRVYILLGILCSAGEAVLELMLPKAMSNIVDYGIGGNGGSGGTIAISGGTVTASSHRGAGIGGGYGVGSGAGNAGGDGGQFTVDGDAVVFATSR